ncbi:MAG: trypsin-like peptidase domain-containing protein [Pseudomonadota bacterium]
MTRRHRLVLKYIGQAIILGLAIAFVLSLLLPQLWRTRAPSVEIRETALPLEPTATRTDGPRSYAAAVERAAPAVVNINTAKVVTVRPNHPFFDDPVLRQLLGRNLDQMVRPQQRVVRNLGSGVIMSGQGYILTNDHVIRGADAIQVTLRDGRTAPARVVGTDPGTDLAVLKIDLPKLPTIVLGHSEQLRVGDIVLAIGNPFGIGQTVTHGIVSATGRNRIGLNAFENFIQTDAAINPGNSGGALVDADGSLIGISSAILSKTGASHGIGLAIPVSMAKGVLEDIIRHGRVIRGWIGIDGHSLTPDIARRANLRSLDGVYITALYRNGPAHRAGALPGDILISINGKKIRDPRDAVLAIAAQRPGSKVKLELLRDGRMLSVETDVIETPRMRDG